MSKPTAFIKMSANGSTFYILSLFILTAGEYLVKSSEDWPLPLECGVNRFREEGQPPRMEDRIVGGAEALLGEFPWIARVGFTECDGTTTFFCGGSLISRYYVVSAAHCKLMDPDIVRLGENYLNTSRDCDEHTCAPPHQDIAIKSFTNHEGFTLSDRTNDYSIIELEKPAVFNDFVKPVCFPSSLIPRDDLRGPLFIAGWGLTDKSGYLDFAEQLMYITAPLKDKYSCNTGDVELLDSQLCIGYKEHTGSGSDSCNGDSGGPVFKFMELGGETRCFFVGVISYGLKKCGTGPAVYTDVSYYAKWTLKTIKGL